MKTGKRLLAMCLMVAMVFTMLPVQVFATDGQAQTVVDTGDLTVQGTNGFGTLLSKEIQEAESDAEKEAEEYEPGYSVIDLVIEGTTATVTYSTVEEAILVVALYTEDGLQMLTSATREVSAEDTEVRLEFEGDMPEYFHAAAYLMDTYDYSPLCASFDTPIYTREMQELLKSTVDDYDEDRVLNLDDDENTNFAVFADTTIIIKPEDGVNIVTSADHENGIYTIENPDHQITDLENGDIFAYAYDENDILIVKVADIEIDGSVVTITETDMEIGEAFSHVKIQGEVSQEDAQVRSNPANKEVQYLGKSLTNPEANQTMSQGASNEFYLNFELDVKKDIFLTGFLTFKAKVGFEFLATFKHQRVALTIDYSLELGAKVEVPKSTKPIDVPLGKLIFPVLSGVTVEFTPALVFSATVTAEFKLIFSGTFGIAINHSKAGWDVDNLCTSPSPALELKVEGTFFVGLKLTPAAKVLDGALANLEVEGQLGVEIKCATSISTDNLGDIRHMCIGCIDGDFGLVLRIVPSIKFLKSNKLKYEKVLIDATLKIGDFYISPTSLDIGFGDCPNVAYKLTIYAIDAEKEPVGNASITVDGQTYTTNAHGVAEIYLPKKLHTINVSYNDASYSAQLYMDHARKLTAKLPLNGTATTDNTGKNFSDIIGEIIYGSIDGYLHDVYSEYELNSKLSNGRSVRLTADLNVDDEITVGGRGTVYLDLNGHNITCTSTKHNSTGNPMIKIPRGVTLIIQDSQAPARTITKTNLNPLGAHAATTAEVNGRVAMTYYVTNSEIINAATGATKETVYEHKIITRGWIKGANVPIFMVDGTLTLESGMLYGGKQRAILANNPDSPAIVNITGGYICGFNRTSSSAAIYMNPGVLNIYSPAVIAGNSAGTFGGAINVRTAQINMYGGIIASNTSSSTGTNTGASGSSYDASKLVGGGAIRIEQSTFNMYNGYISNNNCLATGYWGGGGAIWMEDSSTLNMYGGALTSNEADAGGAVKTEDTDAVDRINITGGFICSNLARYAEGGGIGIGIYDTGVITGGHINNNHAECHMDWGGGGVFVASDGYLNLTNVLVTNNKAGGFGGGIAGCSTGQIDIGVTQGAAIYNNEAEGKNTSGSESTKNEDHTLALSDPVFMENGYADLFSALKCTVKATMLGGSLAYWQGTRDGAAVRSYTVWHVIRSETVLGLTSCPTTQGIANAQAKAKVFFNGNSSYTHGGAILCNGYMEIGAPTAVVTDAHTLTSDPMSGFSKDEVSPYAVYPGEYSTEIMDSYTAKDARFQNLVPFQQYILLAMKSIDAEDPLAPDNLLYIDQAPALEDGTLSFRYVQRETADVSYVVACGASNKDLADADITFPEMTADSVLQVVNPTVVYDGKTLTEGIDYTIVGTVDFMEVGEYTCYIRGIRNYTGLVECTYTVSEAAPAGVAITAHPQDFLGNIGDTAAFTVEVDQEDVTYQWYFSSDNCSTWQKSDCTTKTMTVAFETSCLGYLYRCEITDSYGNTVISDAAALVEIGHDLIILTQPVSYVGAVNDNVTFTVKANGNGLTYEWFFSNDGGETWAKTYSLGYQTNTLEPILRSHRDGNMYKCVVTDVLGNSVESDAVSMTVETGDIIIVTQPVSVENAVLSQLYGYSVVAEGVNLTYRWELSTDGGETWQESWNQGYNTANLSVRMNANRDGNLYRCAITSGQKLTVYTDAVMLDMQDSSVGLIGQSGNVFVTANKTATFTVNAEGTDLSYLWYRSNDKGNTWIQTYLSGYNTNTLSFVGNTSRSAMYMCKITDGSGKVIWSSPVKLQILSAELKILTQPASVTCASDATATFTVEAQGDSLKYQWEASSDGGATWTPSYLGGYNTDTFSFAVNTARAAKQYRCVVTDVAGNTVATNAVSVTIG